MYISSRFTLLRHVNSGMYVADGTAKLRRRGRLSELRGQSHCQSDSDTFATYAVRHYILPILSFLFPRRGDGSAKRSLIRDAILSSYEKDILIYLLINRILGNSDCHWFLTNSRLPSSQTYTTILTT